MHTLARPAQAPLYIGPKRQSMVHLTAQIQSSVVQVQVRHGLASLTHEHPPV